MIFPEILAEMRRPRDFVKVSLVISSDLVSCQNNLSVDVPDFFVFSVD